MNKNILVCGDTHLPYSRVGYLEFCQDIQDKYKCDTVIHIGDVIDLSAISFHFKNPEMPNALAEHEAARQAIKHWYKAFPKMKAIIGNHETRLFRVAGSVNIPSQMLKSFNDLFDTPKWQWAYEYVIDETLFVHGTDNGGIYPAYNLTRKIAMSCVLGHWHSACGIKFLVNPYKRFFSMDVGCGVDDRLLAFQYAQFRKVRSVLSCGVILDGMPQLHLMPCSRDEKYHDSNFRGK